MVLSLTVKALLIAWSGGIVAALYKLSKERKKSGSDYDWVDFVLQSVTASFAGIIGFFIAQWQFTDTSVILACTGIASTGGYPMLVSIKESVFALVKSRLVQPITLSGSMANKPSDQSIQVDDYVGFTDPVDFPEADRRERAGRRAYDPRVQP